MGEREGGKGVGDERVIGKGEGIKLKIGEKGVDEKRVNI
jgi:hypothetical protein